MTDQAPPALDLSKYVDTHFFGGKRPHVRGRRLPIAIVASAARANNWNIAEIAYAYTISETEVLAALLYYNEHQAEIDAYEQAYAAVTPEEWIKYGDDAPLLRRDDATSSSE